MTLINQFFTDVLDVMTYDERYGISVDVSISCQISKKFQPFSSVYI